VCRLRTPQIATQALDFDPVSLHFGTGDDPIPHNSHGRQPTAKRRMATRTDGSGGSGGVQPGLLTAVHEPESEHPTAIARTEPSASVNT